ncbi:MurR/RpiR family transcriptional regulator [Faecalicatena sp. AGMB00832]|uniref:MurR/RpiR family transcriptional regulator n=1 Tax=Faecalicatena faecalis TaxID=2726362 RepID=A0ABS6D2J4_9FIRM|nr:MULTISPECIES: MurR/RpiR family transcriptional regulator [Faecalicatena]MBU3875427.1 MurR/RpiR family transcriptional regulator [Faecalicatena faecalis]MCI6468030.1 MurR/RpiR family transcriptional regulator [Faecalicatena sp.]MDY5618507.1 MurR/RpiR family transcriptional regulator [Lachnospiraceae bacterium]
MVLDTLKEQKEFTNSEKMIAQFILQHMNEIGGMTVIQLADQSYTSKASVIRLCKKLGFQKYQDFRQQIVLERQEVTRIEALLSEEPVNGESTYEDIVNVLPSIYDKAISNTKLGFDRNVIRRVINRIRQSEKVEFYGMGITYTVARSAAFKFMTVGVEASAYNGVNEHNIMVNKKKRVAFVISFTGSNSGMIHTAKFLSEHGVFIVGLGGEDSEELRKVCHEFIQIDTKKNIMSMEVITSITSANYIIDVIFTSLIVDHYQENLEAAIEIWKMRQK